jgi:thiol-disulfide isomerase/thioredoxin
MATKSIVTHFESRQEFLDILKVNPGFIVVKFGADWCGPCKKIHDEVNDFFSRCPETVICCDIDIDDSFDLYAFMKRKKMANGIPVIMVWKKGSEDYIPDYTYVGSDKAGLNEFVTSMLSMF